MDNVTNYTSEVGSQEKVKELSEVFLKDLKDNCNFYKVKCKDDRMECCQALKQKERKRKLLQIYETNKKLIREKYKFCNLYVKGLPDSIDEDKLRNLFEKFGKIRSCKTVRKELYQSYLGIKRSVKVSGFVCYEEAKSAKAAKTELNNTNPFPNHPKLYVDFHQTKNERNEFLKLQMINSTHKAFQNIGSGSGEQAFPGQMGQMPKGMKGFEARVFGPHMLRKFPPQTGFAYPKNHNQNQHVLPMNHPMNQMFPQQFNSQPNFGQFQQPVMNQVDPNLMNPNDKRDYYGDQLFTKISSNVHFSQFEEYFSKIVGIFLDLDEQYIVRLIADDKYFADQVHETVRQLRMGGKM